MSSSSPISAGVRRPAPPSFMSDPSPSSSTYIVPSNFPLSPSDNDEIASLPSEPTSSDDDDDVTISDDDYSDAEEQWKESIQQLELLLTMVLVPFIGKYFGRKCAYWGWTKFMEWNYPIEVIMANKAASRRAGIVGAASL